MRHLVFVATTLLALTVPASAAHEAGRGFDWKQWRRLPVLDGGRHKPLDSLAWETWRMIGNRAGWKDPDTGEKLDATALYLVTLFEWQGWDHPRNPHMAGDMNPSAAYFASHKPDQWDRASLILLDSAEVRRVLGIAEHQKHISPLELSQAVVRDPHSGRQTPFLAWAGKLERAKRQGLTTSERKGLELAERFWSYQEHRMGRRLEVLPLADSEHQEWASVARLMQASLNEKADPTGAMRKAKELFQSVRTAYLAGSADEFNNASAELIATLQEFGPSLGAYPSQSSIDLEVAYNHWVPFRFAWGLSLLACISVLLSMGTRWKPFYVAAVTCFSAGVVAMLIGFGMRSAISGRAPVTNMYESVIYVGLGIAVFGLIFELIYRRQYILAAAAAVATFTLILADNCPALLDPALRPLQPVLRSNFWLVTHVMTITLSYAAFALALGIADIALGYRLFGSANEELSTALSRFVYQSLQAGVLLLAIGIILGGVWAEQSWGRFWGWDPKEVWALIALLGYLAVLHARYIGWVGDFGLAALSVICFSLVVVAWYGVNFVLGAGLHSYGFGGGGQGYVGAAVLAQFLYVAAAGLRRPQVRPADGTPSPSPAESTGTCLTPALVPKR